MIIQWRSISWFVYQWRDFTCYVQVCERQHHDVIFLVAHSHGEQRAVNQLWVFSETFAPKLTIRLPGTHLVAYSFSRLPFFDQRGPAFILSWMWDWSHLYLNAERGKWIGSCSFSPSIGRAIFVSHWLQGNRKKANLAITPGDKTILYFGLRLKEKIQSQVYSIIFGLCLLVVFQIRFSTADSNNLLLNHIETLQFRFSFSKELSA